MLPALAHDPVFVIDDDPAGRESVAAVVRAHGLEVEAYESAEAFLACFDRRSSGCIVVDVRMPGMSGMELQERLVEDGISLPIVMITGYADIPTAVQAMRNGALTYLEKPCSDQKLWESISRAFDLEAASRLQRQQHTDIIRRLKTLSADEHRVLDKLLAGKPNKLIARDLNLGLRTVELRRARLLEKMRASSLAELVQMAMLVKMIASNPLDLVSELPVSWRPAVELSDDRNQGSQTNRPAKSRQHKQVNPNANGHSHGLDYDTDAGRG